MTRQGLIVFVIALGALPACAMAHNRITGAVSVESGDSAKDLFTVNDGVHLAENASAGRVNTVNGAIALDSSTQVTSLDSVNGGISVGENVQISHGVSTVNGGVALGKATRVAGGVSAVNGAVSLDNDTEVAGKVVNVNGRIGLQACTVRGGLKTETGDIDVGANARVEGGILVKKSREKEDEFSKRPVPRVVIGPGAVVQGPIRLEREVKLFVSDTARIEAVEGAEIVRFSGEKPPE